MRQALDEAFATFAKRKGVVQANVSWPPRAVVREQLTLDGGAKGEDEAPAAE